MTVPSPSIQANANANANASLATGNTPRRPLAATDPAAQADQWLALLRTDANKACEALNALTSDLTRSERSLFGRVLDVRLGIRDRSLVSASEAGRMLLFQIATDRANRPEPPQRQIFATPKAAAAYFAALLCQYGSREAQQRLRQGRPSLLALRRSSSTLANRGLGSYDDQLAVLNAGGVAGQLRLFPICTEPGAQYSQRADKGTSALGLIDQRYAMVSDNKKNEGADVNGDGIKDIGRLVAATYHYHEKKNGHLGARAFMVKTTQVAERDTDGDGWFTLSDPSRIDPSTAGTSMYIHRGGNDGGGANTWSAGCQTIPGRVYGAFLGSLGGFGNFFYVLVNAR